MVVRMDQCHFKPSRSQPHSVSTRILQKNAPFIPLHRYRGRYAQDPLIFRPNSLSISICSTTCYGGNILKPILDLNLYTETTAGGKVFGALYRSYIVSDSISVKIT